MPDFILAIDQGTTSTRAILFDGTGSRRRSRQKELPQIFPQPGWVEHDPEEIWRATVGRCAEAPSPRRRGRATSPPSASPTSAKPPSSGTARPASRSTTPSSGRTGARADLCRSCSADGIEPMIQAATGLLHRSLFLGDQDRLAPGQRAGRARGGRARRARLRHHRQLPAVAADRRQGACDRRHQRLAHHAVRHPPQDWDAELLRAFRRAARAAARGAWTAPPSSAPPTTELLGAAIPIARHRRRPAGGDDRPGLLRARHDQEHLRHRLLRAAEHRRASRSRSKNRLLDDRRLPAERQKSPMPSRAAIFVAGAAVQWLRDGLKLIAGAARPRRSRAGSSRQQRRLPGAGLHRARRAVLGPDARAARSSA